MRFAILATGLLFAAAIAGCANTTTPTPATTTPAASTPTPMTPTPSTPTMMSPTPMMQLPDCPIDTPATAAEAASGASELVYTVTEPAGTDMCYHFHGPKTAASGWVNITIVNTNKQPHQVQLMALGNMSFSDFAHALREPPTNSSMDMHAAGGPEPYGGPQAGPFVGNTTVAVMLEPGNYAIVCFVPDMKGTPHAMMGMVAPLTVGSHESNRTEPTSDIDLTLNDYKFTWGANLTAGNHTLRVTNNGMHHHEAVLIHMQGNHTAQDFIAAFDPNATAPPPITELSGTAALASGDHDYVYAHITPGNWALICFEQDSNTEPPHFVKGMILDFVVA